MTDAEWNTEHTRLQKAVVKAYRERTSHGSRTLSETLTAIGVHRDLREQLRLHRLNRFTLTDG
jgi:hypothetical protein